MSASVDHIVAELDRLLQPQRFKDYCPNGIQVPGREGAEAETIVTGVSASLALFERAREEGAHVVLVHHGLFWGSGAGPIDASMKRRLKLLFDTDTALLAYHLPLDAHPKLGNNALLAKALGAEWARPFGLHSGEPIGCIATFGEEGLSSAGEDGLFARLARATAREPLVFDSGPTTVREVAIVTGAGTDFLPEAIAAGADALITGEPAERAMSIAAEGGIHFLAAGHYATETFGVRAVGEHLKRRFGMKHVFVEVPNPI